MKRTTITVFVLLALAALMSSAGAVQQNGFFNAQSTFPTAPQQVLLKIDFATSSSSIDQFYMAVIMTRADVLAQSYYGIYSKADAITLRDTLNRVLPPLPGPTPSGDPTPPPVASSTRFIPNQPGMAVRDVGQAPLAVQPLRIVKTPPRPKDVPPNAFFMGPNASGDSYHWAWTDKQGVNHLKAVEVNTNPNAIPSPKGKAK